MDGFDFDPDFGGGGPTRFGGGAGAGGAKFAATLAQPMLRLEKKVEVKKKKKIARRPSSRLAKYGHVTRKNKKKSANKNKNQNLENKTLEKNVEKNNIDKN